MKKNNLNELLYPYLSTESELISYHKNHRIFSSLETGATVINPLEDYEELSYILPVSRRAHLR